jgi:hypothetical protein
LRKLRLGKSLFKANPSKKLARPHLKKKAGYGGSHLNNPTYMEGISRRITGQPGQNQQNLSEK